MADKEIKKKSNPISKFTARVLQLIQKLFQRQKSLIRPGSSWQDVNLDINTEVKKYLEMRHVQEDEIKQVIYNGETTGEKLYQPKANKYLAKLKIGRATFYVDYSLGEDKFIIKSAYAHRSEITG